MKIVLKVICIIFALFVCIFPFQYKHSYADKKEVKASHILVAKEELAKEIKAKLDKEPRKFEEFAKKYSECPSGKDGGDIGFSQRGVILPEVEEVVFNSELNKITEPVKSPEGWHIIKVTDIRYFSDKENFAKRY
ncbi:peptidyl-prolyl cis-trans isomerase [bacterium]|nr:peptidyl-prolyl cis-trans isomerase [bacterium]